MQNTTSGSEHKNAFGMLRILFASLVIVSHTPALHDASPNSEILYRLFGGLSFGEIAVDGFFIISGYLITKSFLKSSSNFSYIIKRIARIYPAYIAAFFLCILAIGSVSGADIASLPVQAIAQLHKLPLLLQPSLPDAFVGTPYPFLDGSMWTLKYEFMCYISVILLGMTGILTSKRAYAATFVASAIAFVLVVTVAPDHVKMPRLIMVFLAGGAMHVFQDHISLRKSGAWLAALSIVLSLFLGKYGDLGVALFGPYLIMSIALLNKSGILTRINNETDISYGLYLYAWPIAKLLFLHFPAISLFMAGALTWVGAVFCGILSWSLIEKPMMDLTHTLMRRNPRATAPAGAILQRKIHAA